MERSKMTLVTFELSATENAWYDVFWVPYLLFAVFIVHNLITLEYTCRVYYESLYLFLTLFTCIYVREQIFVPMILLDTTVIGCLHTKNITSKNN